MFDKFLSLIKQNLLAAVILVSGLICVGIGVTQVNQQEVDQNKTLSNDMTQNTSSPAPLATSKPSPVQEAIKSEIAVDVQGSVNSPGVYKLNYPARVSDALVLAGELSESADSIWVARNINRAQLLADGDKIYIPSKGEVKSAKTIALEQITASPSASSQQQIGYIPASPTPAPTPIQNNTSSNSQSVKPSAKVSINTASESELDTLEGIGEARAKKIIENRPYNSIDELVSKKVLYKSTFEKIKDELAL